jgi:hypothetical protein
MPNSSSNTLTQRQIYDSQTASEQYETDLQNERALRGQGKTDDADKAQQRVMADIARLIADQTPGSTGPSGVIWNPTTPTTPTAPTTPTTPGGRFQPPPINYFPPN